MTSLHLALLDLTILLLALIHWDFMQGNYESTEKEVRCYKCNFFTTKSRCIMCNEYLCEDCYVGIGSSQMCSSCYIK